MVSLVEQLGKSIYVNTDDVRLNFRSNDFDIRFGTLVTDHSQLTRELELAGFDVAIEGKVLTVTRKNSANNFCFYPNLQSLAEEISRSLLLLEQASVIVLDSSSEISFAYNKEDKKEIGFDGETIEDSYKAKNLSLYLSLLRLFKDDRRLSEFDDKVKSEILVIDNKGERNLVRISYELFSPRLFSKKVIFDFDYFAKKLTEVEYAADVDWIAIFKHNVVSFLSAQEQENKTLVELFLNMQFIISSTQRDYEIFISGFSFEKVKQELKSEKEKYFDSLNQAQEKIKSQVIAVPLSLGTSIFAFFQMEGNQRTYWFVIVMISIYIGFISWYLALYEKDLKKLEEDILEETDRLRSFVKIYEIFENDFLYIIKKVKSVQNLSCAIQVVIWANLFVLIIYVVFFLKEPTAPSPFRFI